jgi:hypothetical protein
MTLSKPFIGMPVHYYAKDKRPGRGVQPQLAFVAYVWADAMVNIALFGHDGHPNFTPPSSITLLQKGDPVPKKGAFCQVIEATDPEAYETVELEDEQVEEDEEAVDERVEKEKPKPKAKGKKKKDEPAADEQPAGDVQAPAAS